MPNSLKTTPKRTLDRLPIPRGLIERRIYLIRGHKVMLDSDLAELYQVPTSRLNEQVRRNLERFPEDFMFQLNKKEAESLRSQIATLKTGRGQHRKFLPYVFTEHGILMLVRTTSSLVRVFGFDLQAGLTVGTHPVVFAVDEGVVVGTLAVVAGAEVASH